jgi:hypothetical protein
MPQQRKNFQYIFLVLHSWHAVGSGEKQLLFGDFRIQKRAKIFATPCFDYCYLCVVDLDPVGSKTSSDINKTLHLKAVVRISKYILEYVAIQWRKIIRRFLSCAFNILLFYSLF